MLYWLVAVTYIFMINHPSDLIVKIQVEMNPLRFRKLDIYIIIPTLVTTRDPESDFYPSLTHLVSFIFPMNILHFNFVQLSVPVTYLTAKTRLGQTHFRQVLLESLNLLS